MGKWLFDNFQGYLVWDNHVGQAAAQGAMRILYFFKENGTSSFDYEANGINPTAGYGHIIQWLQDTVKAAEARRGDVVWWLYQNIDEASLSTGDAFKEATKNGDIPLAQWVLAQSPDFDLEIARRERVALQAVDNDRPDALYWLAARGWLDETVGLPEKATELGRLEIVQLLIEDRLFDFKGEAGHSIHAAAVNGHLDVAKYLREQPAVDPRYSPPVRQVLVSVSALTMTKTAENGHLDVKWLYEECREEVSLFECGQNGQVTAMDAAAKNGHLNIVKYLHEIQLVMDASARKRKRDDSDQKLQQRPRPACTTAAMDNASANDHLDVVQWLHEHHSEGCSARALDDEATGGHLRVVKWLVDKRQEECTSAGVDGAARNGHLEVVKWLYRHQNEGGSSDAMDDTAGNGHLSVVRWLHENTSCRCSVKAMDLAATNGHLDVVKWLHVHRSEGCSIVAMNGAAANGHLDVVKWLHTSRTEGCTQQAIDQAARNGHLAVIQWLYSHRCGGCSSAATDRATEQNHWKVFLYLHSHCHIECSDQAAILTYDIMEVLDLHNWILDKYPAFRALVD